MSESPSWRELLGEIIANNPAERERIATEVGVRSVTLTRWVQGTSSPRPQNIRQLLQALPHPTRLRFLEHLGQQEPELASFSMEESGAEIDYTFLMEVHRTRATSPDVLLFWSITRLILQHALRQLDPERIGLAITVVKCMPPLPDGRIRSLRESVGQGTTPWSSNLEDQATFLGVESLAGYAVARGHLEVVQDLTKEHTFTPAYQGAYEVSAIASPIMYCNRVAGCLLFSSTQANYFLSPSRLSLVEGYTHLAALAFKPEEFYPLDAIELTVMPSPAIQQQAFVSFRHRVVRLMLDASETQSPLTSIQAEGLAWRQLEAEFMESTFQRSTVETTRQ